MRNGRSGKVVAVTGGAMGIGREIARQLAAAGAHVARRGYETHAVTDTEGSPH